jgi:hypothetical protein
MGFGIDQVRKKKTGEDSSAQEKLLIDRQGA